MPSKTIRYYEEIGLVRPAREANNYRRFRPEDVHKLPFLGRARALGFGIEDCRMLLALWEDKARASAEVKRIATGHLMAVDAKVSDLRAMRGTLAELVEAYASEDRSGCQIYDR